MKKVFSCILSFALLFSVTTGFHITANALTYEKFEYVVENGEVTITDYAVSKEDTQIIIPDSIDGYPVTAIGDGCFYFWEYSEIYNEETRINFITKNVTLPSTLKTIGAGAFMGMVGLTEIELPETLEYIGEGAFYLSGLTYVEIPASVRYIGLDAFTTCYRVLNSSVTPSYDFPDIYITIDSGNMYYKMWNDILFNKDGTRLIQDFSQDISVLTIPDTVQSIDSGAFGYSYTLEKIIISENVQDIGYAAFYTCTALEEILVDSSNEYYCSADGVLYTKDMQRLLCFPSCLNIAVFTVPDGVKIISEYAIQYSEYLTEIDLNNVETIEAFAFHYSSLKNATFSQTLQSIDSFAFYGSDVESVVIPDSVTSLGSEVFSHCTGLKSICIGTGITELADLLFEECTALETIEIPESVTSIAADCFAGDDFERLTIRGALGSCAQQFADENSITFDCGAKALGTTIRINENPGLKFGFSVTYSDKIDEVGFVYSYSEIEETQLVIDNSNIKTKKADNFVIKNGQIFFNLVFVNIPFEGIESNIYVRAYVKSGGHTYYSEMINNNYNNVASQIIMDESVDDDTKQKLYEIFSKYYSF